MSTVRGFDGTEYEVVCDFYVKEKGTYAVFFMLNGEQVSVYLSPEDYKEKVTR